MSSSKKFTSLTKGWRIVKIDKAGATLFEDSPARQGSANFYGIEKAVADVGTGDYDLVVIPRGEIEKFLRRPTNEISTDGLADQMLPDFSIPSPAKALSAQREATVRSALLQEFGAYTSEELGVLRSKAANVHALAGRWRAANKIFSVEYHGRRLFPGFQFEGADAAPLPVVAAVLAALPREEMSDWEVALWWVAANEWLAGRRPVDLIAEGPEALPAAAAHLAEPSAL
jgi:hypothetical protein